MNTPTTFRKNETSLRAYDTLKPLIKRLKGTIRGGWITITYLYVVTLVLLWFSQDHAHITFGVLILHAIIVLVIYFKNNKRNGRLFSALKEYEDVQKVHLLSRPYKNILNFTRIIIVLDAILGPVIWPVKFLFFIFYKIFRYRIRRVKKEILQGKLVLTPTEDEIVKDPFYNFLMREGLYESSFDIDEDDKEELSEEEGEEKDDESSEKGESKEIKDEDSDDEDFLEEEGEEDDDE